MELKNIKGKLYEYQKVGIEFLLNSGGRALLADSPGVGKTAQALGFVAHSGFKRTLVVCPASVKFCWSDEIIKWTDLTSFVVEPNTIFKDIPHDTNIIIINYDVLKKYFNELMKYKFDVLIGDEVQMIKSIRAIRARAFKAISRNIPNVIMLTGTPVLSRPIEIFNCLNIINEKVWNNYYSYATRYCDGKQGYWGFESKGSSNLEELRERISKFFLRRTKEEVLRELPPKTFIDVPIDLNKEYREAYNLVEENLIKYLREFKNKNNKEILRSLAGEKLVKLNLLREITAMGKIVTAKELIDNIIEAGEKVLVFSSFNTPLKELSDIYEENSVMIIGETPVEERGQLVKKFQESKNIQVFLGGTKSAGTGLTLTSAANVICLDLPFNPADLEQQINRAHRPGAVYQNLNIYTILARDSIDGFLKKLLKHKQDIIDRLIEGKESEDSTEGMVDDYLREIELKYEISKH